MDYPDSPEGVALELTRHVVRAEGKPLEQLTQTSENVGNQPVRAYILDTYAECLIAARGERHMRQPDTGVH